MLARPLYEPGKFLSAGDCRAEQKYRLQKFRRHNRYLHGYGVVCGLLVAPGGDPARPWAVRVCPGYALGPYGDEIELCQSVLVDLRDFLWTEPPAGAFIAAPPRRPYVAIRHREQGGRLAPVPQSTCGCPDPIYEPARTKDGAEAGVLWSRPQELDEVDICKRQIVPCRPCPPSPWIVLARILLPAVESEPITAARIDLGIARKLS